MASTKATSFSMHYSTIIAQSCNMETLVRLPHKFTKENFLVAVQTVNNQIQQSTHLHKRKMEYTYFSKTNTIHNRKFPFIPSEMQKQINISLLSVKIMRAHTPLCIKSITYKSKFQTKCNRYVNLSLAHTHTVHDVSLLNCN